jgi:predicted nucleic acid-binding protein
VALLISDANIFIDFEEGGLLRELFLLSDRIGVPDILFEDELRQQHGHLLRHGLELLELRSPAMERARALAALYRRPSRLDVAALALAEQEGCPLLTGDRHLRAAAESEGVEVRGTLWLGERLVVEGVIRLDQLKAAYGDMRKASRRLPWLEVDRQIKRLGEGP